MALTDDAKAEIAAAIAIVRADRFEAHARSVMSKFTPPEPKVEPKDELITTDPPEKVVPPEKKKEPVVDTPPPGRRSSYWGEILDD
jgi:hypothetical protein